MKTQCSLFIAALIAASVFAGPEARLPDGRLYETGVLRVTLKDEFAANLSLRDGVAAAVKAADISGLHSEILRVEARHLAARNWLKGAKQPAHLVNKGRIPRIARNVRLVLKPGADALKVAEELKRRPEVENVSLNFLYLTNALPNDPSFPLQWGMNRIGIPDGDWDVPPRGAIRVAIVDTGIDLQHPEFSGRIVFGHDYVNDTDDGDAPTDRRAGFDHGTHVAGIAAATRNNNTGVEGVAGVSNNIELMAMRCAIWSSGSIPPQYAVGSADDAIDDAVANGARVINCSFRGGSHLDDALNNARDHNVLVVAAAGNDNMDITNTSWALSPVPFIVSASMQANPPTAQEIFATGGGIFWPNSNFGPRVNLCAPGTAILSTVPTGGPLGLMGEPPITFDRMSGTSMAAPHVAGVAAHLMSMNPDLIEDDSAKHLLVRMCQDAGPPGKDDQFGSGLLRLGRDFLEVLRSANAFVSNIDDNSNHNGAYNLPWGDIQTGLDHIPDQGVLVLNGGDVSAPSFSYPPIEIRKACTLSALPGSPVTIGQ